MPEGSAIGFRFRSSDRLSKFPLPGIKAGRRTSSKYCDCDHLPISTYLPIHFLGMRPNKFIVKMLFFSSIIKKIFIYLYAWPHVSPWCAGKVWVAVQMRLDTVILAAGTVRIATPPEWWEGGESMDTSSVSRPVIAISA
jgi:hypothetical protein